jgi:hypothetical protein
MSVWIMLMKQVAWMMCIFGPQQYGIPDLETTDPKEIKEYLLSFKKSFKHKK